MISRTPFPTQTLLRSAKTAIRMFKRRVRRRCTPRSSRLVAGSPRDKRWSSRNLAISVLTTVVSVYRKEIFEHVRSLLENLLARFVNGDHSRRAVLTAARAER